MGDHPEVQWALDAFTPDPNETHSFLARYYYHATGAFMGAGSIWYHNWATAKPIHAGIPLWIGAGIIGTFAAIYVKQRLDKSQAYRDQLCRDYIIRHPEDFPEPVRKKFSEVLWKWHPVR